MSSSDDDDFQPAPAKRKKKNPLKTLIDGMGDMQDTLESIMVVTKDSKISLGL